MGGQTLARSGERWSGSDGEPFRTRENGIKGKGKAGERSHHDAKLPGDKVGKERWRSRGSAAASSSSSQGGGAS